MVGLGAKDQGGQRPEERSPGMFQGQGARTRPGTGDKDPGCPETGVRGPRSPGTEDRGPRNLEIGNTRDQVT